MFGIGKKKVSPVEEKTITTPILKTTILISEDGTDPFVTSEYSGYPHNGLSHDDIANKEAMEYKQKSWNRFEETNQWTGRRNRRNHCLYL